MLVHSACGVSRPHFGRPKANITDPGKRLRTYHLPRAFLIKISMPGHAHGKGKGKTRKVTWHHVPQDSISNPDPTFFHENNTNMNVDASSLSLTSHSQSKTWKSQDAKERDQFSRVHNLVHHFVPESPFPPQTYGAWVEHRAGMNEEKKEDLLKNIELVQARKSVDARIPLRPAFIPEGIMPLNDNRSTVLSLPSIWSNNYMATADRPDPPWPDRSEMQHEGDDRAAGDGGKTNFQRYLPLPRRPGNETVNWKERFTMEPQSIIDVTQLHPSETCHTQEENQTMNEDDEFWIQGMHYLGLHLMREL